MQLHAATAGKSVQWIRASGWCIKIYHHQRKLFAPKMGMISLQLGGREGTTEDWLTEQEEEKSCLQRADTVGKPVQSVEARSG